MIPLGFPYFRIFNIGWLPFLNIKKFGGSLTWKYKSYQMSISCFLIDMKFISKLSRFYQTNLYDFPIPSFTTLFHARLGTQHFKNTKTWYLWHTCFENFHFSESHIYIDNISPGCFHIFLYRWMHFGNS